MMKAISSKVLQGITKTIALGVFVMLFTCSLSSREANAEFQRYGCFAGEYIVSRSVVRAKNEKSVEILNELTTEPLEASSELHHGILVTEKAIGLRSAKAQNPEDKPVTPYDTLCENLRKERRRSRMVARGRASLRAGERSTQIVRRFDCTCNSVIQLSKTPDDSKYPLLWGMNNNKGYDIDAPEAWDTATDADSVVVMVIDTGVDYNHEDLKANMWVNPFEIPGNGIDDEGNGYVDDIHGINGITRSGDPMDDHGHGTHCAGTIGGVGDNGRGVAGVAWKTHIMGGKFLGASGSGSLWDAMRVLEYAVDMKRRGVNLRLTNNSWGGGGFFSGMYQLLKIHQAEDILFVAAAGNASHDNDASPSYPVSYDLDNIIGVAAVDENGNLANFSSYGATRVDVGAPGVSIASTYPGNRYTYMSGTSMATPHVAGVLTLLLGYNWNLTGPEAKQIMMSTGKSLPALAGRTVTGKMVNMKQMLDASPPPPEGSPPGPNPSPSASPSASSTPSASPSASPSMIPVPGTYDISGDVVGANQVKVEFRNEEEERSVVTGGDGHFSFDDIVTPPHAFDMVASKEGYITQTFSGFLSGTNQVVNFTMIPKQFSVQGTVLDSTGQAPLGELRMLLYVDGTFRSQVFTDSSGQYSFTLRYGEDYEVRSAEEARYVRHVGEVLGDVRHIGLAKDIR